MNEKKRVSLAEALLAKKREKRTNSGIWRPGMAPEDAEEGERA